MSPYANVFLCFAGVLGLFFIIDCLRYRMDVNRYVRYGMLVALIVLALSFVPLLSVPFYRFRIHPVLLVVGMLVSFVQYTLCSAMGMYCCARLHQPGLPLVRRLFHRSSRLRVRWFSWRHILPAAAVVVAGVAYSWVLFSLSRPTISDMLKELSRNEILVRMAGNRPSWVVLFVLLQFAVAEEIVFRLGVQNYLAWKFNWSGTRYAIPVVITASVWSLAHANILDPEWVKIAQIFPLGIALGFLFRRFGAESCILVHGLFNIIMMFLGPRLIFQ